MQVAAVGCGYFQLDIRRYLHFPIHTLLLDRPLLIYYSFTCFVGHFSASDLADRSTNAPSKSLKGFLLAARGAEIVH